MSTPVNIAIVQQSPVHGDKKASLQKALTIIEEAAENKTNLIVFGETWFPGYPAWLDHCPDIGLWDHPPVKKVFANFYKNALEINGEEIKTLCAAAKKYKQIICTGFNEKVSSGAGNGTVYNSVIIINESGEIKNHRRKLMPTFTEKLLYGLGDGKGLESADTPFGRMGSMICWEHWMPLTRQAMHNSGEHIHIALWPNVHELLQVASRHYAFEGRCYVIAAGQIFRISDIPEGLTIPKDLKNSPQKMLLRGGSCVFGPDGKILLEPQWDKDETIYFTIEDLDKTLSERMTLDVSGHYNRPDLFEFSLKKS